MQNSIKLRGRHEKRNFMKKKDEVCCVFFGNCLKAEIRWICSVFIHFRPRMNKIWINELIKIDIRASESRLHTPELG